MGNIFNDDFRDFISSLNSHRVEYILVGGYSVILHGYPRTTGDLDIWVNRTEENYSKIENSFKEFGMSVFDMTKENFLYNPEYNVFSFGRPPVSIDLLVEVKGLHFAEAFSKSFVRKVDQIEVRVIHIDDLKVAKKASNRPKDQDDLDNLES